MDALSACFTEETIHIRGEDEEEEEEEVKEEKGEEVQKDHPAVEESASDQKQQKPAWAPCFFHHAGKEVYNYVGQRIIIEEAFDSYAGMIWPAALALCHYLDTHREQLNLVDKAVLEIGAGTGLVSIVAALLGGWVTATDLPEVLSNLRFNLFRNTRRHARHMPQVAVLSWGYDLECSYPSSVYRYDYVLAADVVYHHDFLEELLATMKHFCKPGTTLIWANKVRFGTDLTFTENFKKAFKTSLLAEDGEMKIFMATGREDEEEEESIGLEIEQLLPEKEERKNEHGKEDCSDIEFACVDDGESDISETERREEEEEEELKSVEGDRTEEPQSDKNNQDKASTEQEAPKENWAPSILKSLNKDIYHYVGEDILIHESIDSYGAVMWPAALALCSFLENNRHTVNLQGKEVLELGAGTGLVTIVASLLGGAATATDLPDVLSNLQANVMRNTRGRCRYTPKVAMLSWGYDLEHTHPTSAHRYDYVLAADVVYHHDFLPELLATMKHFCCPGTTLIWANKVRFPTDLTFTENFKKAFNTSLLFEDGEMKIFMATNKEGT